MGLQSILDKIRSVGDVQINEIERNAKSQANEIFEQAHLDAKQIEAVESTRSSMPATAERSRILHRARLDALHVVSEVREKLVDTAISQACDRLASFRSDSNYPNVLRTLTEEALAQLASSEGDGNFEILADPRDKALVEHIIKDLGVGTFVRYDLTCSGGVIAQSEDGRVVVINTFESRLEQSRTFIRHRLAALFEEERSDIMDVQMINHG